MTDNTGMGDYERQKRPDTSTKNNAVTARKPLPKGADDSKPRALQPGEKPLPKQVGALVPSNAKLQQRHTTMHERAQGFGHAAGNGEGVVSRGEAELVVIAAADIVQHGRRNEIASAPARFHSALELLYAAVTGKDRLGGADQVRYLDAAMVMLEPAVSVFRHDHDDAVWLDEQLIQPLTSNRSSARYARAVDRVDNSLRIDGTTVEMPNDSEPRKQAALLHQEITKLAPEMLEINEQVLRANHEGIEHEAEKLLEGEGKGRKLNAGSLVQLQATLWLIDGFLTLSDEEFQHELAHVQGLFNGVATYAELVRVATELLAGSVVTTASFTGALAGLAGDATSAALCAGVARSAGMVFGNVIAGAEIVHGVFVLLDPHASAQKKLDAAAGVASGSAWFIGVKVGGAAAGFAASTAIMLGYAELKYAARLYWEANLGLTTGLMRLALETIHGDGASIARAAEMLAKVDDLLATETDLEKAADLKRVHESYVKHLIDSLDSFLDDAAPRGFEAGIAHYPGAWPIFLELFSPLAKFKGAKTEAVALEGATEALEKITWALAHSGDIALASARQKHLGDLEEALAAEQAHSDEKAE